MHWRDDDAEFNHIVNGKLYGMPLHRNTVKRMSRDERLKEFRRAVSMGHLDALNLVIEQCYIDDRWKYQWDYNACMDTSI